MRRELSYLICGIPRSGTSLLAGLLAGTGVAGRPEEYFWRDNEPDWATADYGRYVKESIQAGTTENGVFGARVMWGYFGELLSKLREARSRADDVSDVDLLEHSFRHPRFVWIWREDAVAQAVSFAKAIQTGQWSHDSQRRGKDEPRFDFTQIDHLVKEVLAHRAAWEGWFSSNGLDPFRVTYEELVNDKVGVTKDVLAFLGITLPRGATITERTRRQADELNSRWIDLYRAT